CFPSRSEECQRTLAGRINVCGAIDHIQRGVINMSDTQTASLSEKRMTASEITSELLPKGNGLSDASQLEMAAITPSDCGCGCGGEKKADCACGVAEDAPKTPQLVYAIGTLDWDFGSATREDSFKQAMSDPNAPIGRTQPSPRNVDDLIAFLNTEGN